MERAAKPSGNAGIFGRLKQAARSVLALLENRLALFALEFEAEKLRLISLFLMGVAALFLLGIGVLIAIATIVLVFWETHRELLLCGFSLFFLVTGAFLLIATVRQWRRPSALFSASLAELRKDQERLDNDDFVSF